MNRELCVRACVCGGGGGLDGRLAARFCPFDVLNFSLSIFSLLWILVHFDPGAVHEEWRRFSLRV